MFDCSAEFASTSPNTEDLQVPKLTSKRVEVPLRFLEGPIVLMGDVEGIKGSPYYSVSLVEVHRMTVCLFCSIWGSRCASFAQLHVAKG